MKMDKIIMGMLMLGLGGLILVNGCVLVRKIIPVVSVSPVVSSPSLSAMQFDDIPVPGNFRHLPDESVVLVDGNVRTAEIKYIATAHIRVDDIIVFYGKHMPPHGWHKVFEKDAGWKHSLTFEKGDEQCVVLVDKTPAKTDLTIKVNLK